MDCFDESNYLKSLLRRVQSVSNKEYQKRVWIEGKGPECDDFDETANFIIGDGEVILKNHKDYNITDSQFVLLKRFCDEFELFSDNYDWPQEFIDTPEWTKITEMAQEVLDAFHWKTSVQNGEN
jgi:hypothetical protein